MYVYLPHNFKGTHMSRFVQILNKHEKEIGVESFKEMLTEMAERLESEMGHIEMRFPYFVRKAAPMSGVESLLDYDATWTAERRDGRTRMTVGITAPVTSLCPCSKSISEYGAHNQRSHITIDAEVTVGEITLEEIARVAEDQASCEVYGLLKRTDEKWVTERAYDNPKFVEDLVRDIALALGRDPRIGRFTVASENFESIHNHSAYAEIEGTGAGRPGA